MRFSSRFEIAFTSALQRAEATLRVILRSLNQDGLTAMKSDDLNERHYGQLTGITKQEACLLWGEDRVKAWQRSYSSAPPGSEPSGYIGASASVLSNDDLAACVARGENPPCCTRQFLEGFDNEYRADFQQAGCSLGNTNGLMLFVLVQCGRNDQTSNFSLTLHLPQKFGVVETGSHITFLLESVQRPRLAHQLALRKHLRSRKTRHRDAVSS